MHTYYTSILPNGHFTNIVIYPFYFYSYHLMEQSISMSMSVAGAKAAAKSGTKVEKEKTGKSKAVRSFSMSIASAKATKTTTKTTKGKGKVPKEPGSSNSYKMGGWVDDNNWTTFVPFPNLDFLNYGYLTCIQTLTNGPCGQPGQRAAYDGPQLDYINGAQTVSFTIGGAQCNANNWSQKQVVNAVKKYNWDGVGVDNECQMTAKDISNQFKRTANNNQASMYSYLVDPIDSNGSPNLSDLSHMPDYFASLTFWGSEYCSDGSHTTAPGCAPGSASDGGYETLVPDAISSSLQQIKQIGGNSRMMLLGLHAIGIDSDAVNFWCNQITSNNLGGVMISYITEMDTTLFAQLKNCLESGGSTPGCNEYTVQSGDSCYNIASATCGDGNNYASTIYTDSSCTTKISSSSCLTIQPGQVLYTDCN